ncbi:MAG TPA: hypothetical protein VMY34_06830 [Acidimicrobiales bacterium]|nr:hypothetical protein [Acidimicrobiales bacterium]
MNAPVGGGIPTRLIDPIFDANGVPTAATSTVEAARGSLATTGVDVGSTLVFGEGLVVVGLLLTRRRRIA